MRKRGLLNRQLANWSGKESKAAIDQVEQLTAPFVADLT